MLSSVSRISPPLGSVERAIVAYRAAHLQACLAELRNLTTVEACVLKSRAYLRLGRPAIALDSLTGADPLTSRERCEVALLRGVARLRIGDREEARQGLREAFVYSISALDPGLEAEVFFYEGLAALEAGDVAAARKSCLGALVAANAGPATIGAVGVVPTEHVVARVQELLAVVSSLDGRYGEALDFARRSLETLDACAAFDVYNGAFALRNLAVFARDIDNADDAAKLAARVPTFAWTDDIRHVEFTTREALGWCAALRGNSVDALRSFRAAASAATTIPEQITIGVDRALVAREFGHHPLVAEEIDHALGLVRTFDWERAAGDTREALLFVAQAAAALAPSEARAALDRHTAIRNAMDGSFAARAEPRARAEEAYTHGVVLRAEGRLKASMERLTFAFETWAKLGFAWRAGRAALELVELDAGDAFRTAVRRELVLRPDSIFANRARHVA